MNDYLRNHPPRLQKGISTLLVAMLLLAIVTVITLFAARYGVSEQRTSGNEYRYKMAFHVAETGLQQSIEYVKLKTPEMLSTSTGGWLYPASMKWQPCTEPSSIDLDPCMAEPDEFRRAGMYRYVGGANNGVLPVASIMPKLDVVADADRVGGFAAGYRSYAALCQLDMTIPDAPQCSLAPNTKGDFYITLVSQGTLAGENSVATVKQSFGTFRLLGMTPDAPLIAASSTALGNAQIVPNADGGGFGVPVSIWTKGDAKVGGGGGASFATCHLGEWLDSGSPTPEDRINGVCPDCTCNNLCPGYGLLSGKANASCSGGAGPFEGEDILDNDGNPDGSGTVISHATPQVQNVRPEDFPRSLFAYLFGVSCDQQYSVDCEEAQQYLGDYARPIPSTDVGSCSSLGSMSGGLYWNTGDCKLTAAQVGSLQRPVVLVSDREVSIAANTRFFGIIFVRSGETFDAAGGGQVYGAVIVEGNAAITGGPTIVYNKAVLANVRNSPDFVRYGPIAGSWSDSL